MNTCSLLLIQVPEYRNKQAEIFESFKQLDSGANHRYSGTSLGLTLAKRMVEMHGGQMQVESVEGRGCRFTFTIPKNTDTTDKIENKVK
ncbi:ATP-binding protein [Methanohalobium evestigatum]|uniref:ATP-binding protein n=1 Tax=Methanohalobium evestigatum TaxID=2322 RepID=UPI000677E8EB|nr:ATP-binding protein [Methanohalobium evestigatum]